MDLHVTRIPAGYNTGDILECSQKLGEVLGRIPDKESDSYKFYNKVRRMLLQMARFESLLRELQDDAVRNADMFRCMSMYCSDLKNKLAKYEMLEDMVVNETLDEYTQRIVTMFGKNTPQISSVQK